MEGKRVVLWAGVGCLAIVLVLGGAFVALLVGLSRVDVSGWIEGDVQQPTVSASQVTRVVVEEVPTLTPVPTKSVQEGGEGATGPSGMPEGSLASLYQAVNPGVVNIRVYVQRAGMTGEGAGSGFLIDDEGHIVTNDHVVAQAEVVTVIFHDGLETPAEVVGRDPDSDLAIVKADEVPQGAHPLQIAASGEVQAGDWVVAIGNPFSLGGSMSLGIVSAVGRTIPTAETPFSIPKAIQTDAAINPGNSGGPLLNLDGQVVGVNAQIRSNTGTSSGVGFAIPSDVVRLVAPALIEEGSYAWPWIGVTGGTVNLLLQEANELETQQGAYIATVVEDGPADKAGLRGATGERSFLGQAVPVGGDVIVEIDGEPVRDFADLLTHVAFQRPGDEVTLTILRDGSREQVALELEARPSD